MNSKHAARGIFLCLLCLVVFSEGAPSDMVAINRRDAWTRLPFTAREWARQALLPYRRIPLRNGGSMSIQEAYDLYLRAGQPEYPDMSTPGLVTAAELEEQVKLSRVFNGRH